MKLEETERNGKKQKKTGRKKTPGTGKNWMILKEAGRNRKKRSFFLSVLSFQRIYMPTYKFWSTWERTHEHSCKFCTTYKRKYENFYVRFFGTELIPRKMSQNCVHFVAQFGIKNPILLDRFQFSVLLHGLEVHLNGIMGKGLWIMVLS